MLLAATAVLAAWAIAPSLASAKTLVYVDPGHGGPYNHAHAYGLKEKNVNLWITRDLRDRLVADGFGVGMTRNADVALTTKDQPTWNWSSRTKLWTFHKDGKRRGDPPVDDLQMRCNAANNAGADLFVSIHNNASSSGHARGAESYASRTDALGRSLSAYVQRALVHQTGLKNRGAKAQDFYVITWTNMPAILVEAAFLDNRYDARLLKKASFRRKIAAGIAIGIEKWLATSPFKRLYPHLGGPGEADVAVAASRAAFPAGATAVLLASSDDVTSAMTAAPLAVKLGAPILVASASGLPTATAQELARLRPTSVIALGPAETLPDSVIESAAVAAGTAAATRRIAGADAYETAALIADEVGVPADHTVIVVPSTSFADALTAAPLSTGGPTPILLARPGGTLPAATVAFFAAHAQQVTKTRVMAGLADIPAPPRGWAPGAVRVSSYSDRYRRNAAVLRSVWPRGWLSPVVTSTARSISGVIAATVAMRGHRPLLLTGGRVSRPTPESG